MLPSPSGDPRGWTASFCGGWFLGVWIAREAVMKSRAIVSALTDSLATPLGSPAVFVVDRTETDPSGFTNMIDVVRK